MSINLHYGPERTRNLIRKGFGAYLFRDHPFGRCMPDEVIAKIDGWLTDGLSRDVVLVEEYPLIYLRYVIRSNRINRTDVHIFWHADGDVRELRIGEEGELLDPWPTGYFDRSLEFVLGAWR